MNINSILIILLLPSLYPSLLFSSLIPLHKAAIREDIDQCKKLLKEGMDVNTKDKYQETPLHKTSWVGCKKTCLLLIQHYADVNTKNDHGDTPLHLAAWIGHKDICLLLIQSNAQMNEKNKIEDTPLHIAARKGQKEICAMLLQNKASIDAKNQWGNTPLYEAACFGHQEICQLLIQYHPPILTNLQGETALSIAKSSEIKNILIAYEFSKITGYLTTIKHRDQIPDVIISVILSFSAGKR